MPEPATSPRPARRRADAERSVAAILDGAARALRDRRDASVEEIARLAGVTRQTVYAHYPSREALINTVMDRATDEAMAAVDAAQLDEGPAAAAMVRLLDASWQAFERYPFLFDASAVPRSADEDRRRHESILDRLERLIRRGQAAREFDPDLPLGWLVAATVALGHAAGTEVDAGRMTAEASTSALRHCVLRVLGATTSHN